MVILPAKFSEKTKSLIFVSILNGFLDHELVSRLYPRQEHKQRRQQSTTVQCASNMMQNMA